MTQVDFHVLKIFLAPRVLKVTGYWVARHGKEKLWGPDKIEMPREQVRKWTEVGCAKIVDRPPDVIV